VAEPAAGHQPERVHHPGRWLDRDRRGGHHLANLLVEERGAILGELAIDRGAAYETFMTEHGGKTHIGLVIYPGDEMVELRKNVWGIPDWYLLGAF
jgi:hypothetical protein